MKPLIRAIETLSRGRRLSSCLLLVACSGGDRVIITDGDTGIPAPAAASPPGLLALTNVANGDDWSTLVGTLRSLDDAAAQLERVQEFPGFADVHADPGRSRVYFVGSGESPTIQRFTLDGGTVTAGPELSFAAYGLSVAPGSTETVFAPSGLAYSVNYDNEVILVWDPEAMTIVKSVELTGLTKAGFSSVYPLSIQIRDGYLFFPVSFINFDSVAVQPLTVLGLLNLETDEVTLLADTRCSGIRSLFAGPDGALYGATDGFFATQWRLHGEGLEPCMLRVPAGQLAFDADYELDSRQLVDSGIVGDLSVSADGSRFFFSAFDEVASPIAADAVYAEVAAAPGWRVYEVPAPSVTSGQPTGAQPIAGLSLGARNGIRFNVSGRSWVGVPTADYSSSTLFDISTTGDTKPGPSFPGSLGRVLSIE